ncbi:DUF4192 domain-containing protein [Nostocoides sp. F2B08]|uniref:DUF4192 domain-containing protein n=1 Tax=Nostocoides sp. F2B08 TaxID=2653936 RepID=UPI00186B1139|nr:DUF4192 domain-containing protein [Tetrasphaera sp. F2B08]
MPTSTSPAAPTVRLRSPGEIVSAVPFLLGFAPEASVVVIALRGGRMTLTCRADLGDVLSDPGPAGSIVAATRRSGATDVLLIGYADVRASAAVAVRALSAGVQSAGLRVQEELTVAGGRWYNEVCHDERCCPSDGVLVSDHDAAPSTMAFQTLSEGYRSGRDDLVRECHPDRPLLAQSIRSELLHPADDEDLLEETLVADLLAVLQWSGGSEPTAAQLARSALACSDPFVRDLWYAVVAPAVMGTTAPTMHRAYEVLRKAGQDAGELDADGRAHDPATRDRVLQRVLRFVRNLPDELPEVTMPALVVAAAAHWAAGDGARARILVERASALPVQPLGMLDTIAQCLARGVGPQELERPGSAGPGDGRESRCIA